MRSHQLPYNAPSDDNDKDKSKRFKPHHHHHHHPLSSSASFPSRRFLLVISGVSLFIAVSSLIYAFSASPPPVKTRTVYRCGRAEDSLRTHLVHRTGVEAPARPKVLGLVGVQTGFGSVDRRAALRNTWFPPDTDGLVSLEHGSGLAFRFVIGHTKDYKNMSELQKEADMYHDFMFIDVDEDNTKPPQKTLAFFKAALDLFDADFYVKADDDIYLRPDRLATLLGKDRAHHMTYIGCMKKGPVITDPKNQWYESKGDLIGTEYFLHAYGPIYALSSDVVVALAAAENDSLRMFSNEDVTIGSWMLSINVNHEDNKAICDPTSTATSIAVLSIPRCSGKCSPAEKIKELHNTTVCSRTPTLPAEDEEDE